MKIILNGVEFDLSHSANLSDKLDYFIENQGEIVEPEARQLIRSTLFSYINWLPSPNTSITVFFDPNSFYLNLQPVEP